MALLAQLPDGGVEPPTPMREAVLNTIEREWVEEWLDDGKYVRFGTKDAGPVHVWRPRFYKKETAELVVYVHGFYTNADGAMREHQLTAQFRDSGRNALFIVPEARSWRTDAVLWPDLEKLVAEVEKRLKLERPQGRVVLIGHSGAYRTLSGWLTHEKVSQVLLVDGLYGNESDFKAWLEAPDSALPRQLVMVGYDTQQRAEWFARKQKAVQLDTLPWLYDELSPAVRRAPLVTVQSERLDHMALVTDGRLLPWLLHAFR